MNLNSVLDKLTALHVPARMVILDCCRDNPLQGRGWLATRSAGGGGGLGELPVQSLPAATLVVYSASPGKPALDRLAPTDLHSPFTQALLDTLPEPGVHSFEVFGRVEENVLTRTEGRQGPRVFYNGSTLPFRTFRFAAGPESATASTPPAALTIIPPANQPPAPMAALTPTAPAPALPANGFFDLNTLYVGGPYLSYNAYSRGKILEKVQEKLKAGGLYPGGVDGAPGPGTQRGILAWQQARSLPLTGLLDTATLTSLELAGLAPMTAPAAPPPRQQRATPAPSPRRSGGGGEMSNEEFLRRARQLEGF